MKDVRRHRTLDRFERGNDTLAVLRVNENLCGAVPGNVRNTKCQATLLAHPQDEEEFHEAMGKAM